MESMGIFMIWERIKKMFQAKMDEENVPFEKGEHDKMILLLNVDIVINLGEVDRIYAMK